ncbi:hypothetical protein [Thiocapsa bogorovii]|uniref:hypothetical protein n=1 Tax=Thiocapsa bogorovii TaxID=521689 RepID=UPI001E46CCAF|nr:hypothetical protein [Thiocapsa bogorovii]UHD17813.1 hypothetical protein LT988_07125 [Thiocapsa bogorovii]
MSDRLNAIVKAVEGLCSARSGSLPGGGEQRSGAQSGQTLRDRDTVFVGSACVLMGFEVVVRVPATIAERGPDWLFSVRLPAVDAEAVLLAVDRGTAFGLADARRFAGVAGDVSVGASGLSGTSSLTG